MKIIKPTTKMSVKMSGQASRSTKPFVSTFPKKKKVAPINKNVESDEDYVLDLMKLS